MDITDGSLQILLYGWLLGILSSVINPFIVVPVQKWHEKQNFKKILKADIKLKLDSLENIEQLIIEAYHYDDLSKVIEKLEGRQPGIPIGLDLIRTDISLDFYTLNYVKLLDYFNDEKGLFEFYESIKSLKYLSDIMEKGHEKNPSFLADNPIFLYDYCGNLKNCLDNGLELSFL